MALLYCRLTLSCIPIAFRVAETLLNGGFPLRDNARWSCPGLRARLHGNESSAFPTYQQPFTVIDPLYLLGSVEVTPATMCISLHACNGM